jgi:hypothetical protein
VEQSSTTGHLESSNVTRPRMRQHCTTSTDSPIHINKHQRLFLTTSRFRPLHPPSCHQPRQHLLTSTHLSHSQFVNRASIIDSRLKSRHLHHGSKPDNMRGPDNGFHLSLSLASLFLCFLVAFLSVSRHTSVFAAESDVSFIACFS